MTPALHALLSAVRRRDALAAALPVLPWLLALAALWALDIFDAGFAVCAMLALAVLASRLLELRRRWRRHDADWLLQRVQDLRPELEDSADLIALDPDRLGAVQRLQRERVLERLRQRALPALHAALPWRLAAAMAVLAALTALAPQWLPDASIPAAVEPSTAPAPPAVQQLDVALRVTPPDYTGRPPREGNQLAVEIEQDSRLRWSLGFAIAPRSVQLVFVDGTQLQLAPEDGRFVGERDIADATLYRVEIEGAGPANVF